MRLLIINGFGTTQTILGNVFLLLSVGTIVAGLTRHAYLAMIAGFQAIDDVSSANWDCGDDLLWLNRFLDRSQYS
jgi:hypothetical protein